MKGCLMKNLLVILAFSLLFPLTVGLTFCGKKGGNSEPATADEVSSEVAKVMCEKVITCTGLTGAPTDECAKQMGAMMKEGITKESIQLSKSELSTCVGSIKNTSCDDIKNSKGAPKGCEKLDKMSFK